MHPKAVALALKVVAFPADHFALALPWLLYKSRRLAFYLAEFFYHCQAYRFIFYHQRC